MAGTIDDILNGAIPIILILMAIFFFYKWFREPIHALFGWIGALFSKGKGKINFEPGDTSYVPRY
jgi:hypothetical protein